jgi:ribosomal protein L11 methylase PrmA
LLIGHVERGLEDATTPEAYKVIEPELIPLITYPYEWCFSQLKDAALATLAIQRTALQHDMILKDASAYNIQFRHGRPVLLDTLSFEHYEEGSPWIAYRQFCQHFLAPLALAARRDVRLTQLLRAHIDGIPLDLASKLLPPRTWLSLGLLAHIHLHAKGQKRYSDTGGGGPIPSIPRISRAGLNGLLDVLERTVRNLVWRAPITEWTDYYDQTNYVEHAMRSKEAVIAEALQKILPAPKFVVDLGANTGRFSRLARRSGFQVIAADFDPAAVEKNYLDSRSRNDDGLLPLVLDLTNPPGGVGWAHEERPGFLERIPRDTVMALALVHHLAISNNVPLPRLALFFHRICKHLIIEFVPKSDSQVRRLLRSREDVFEDYDEPAFKQSFGRYFEINYSRLIEGSERSVYLMQAKDDID